MGNARPHRLDQVADSRRRPRWTSRLRRLTFDDIAAFEMGGTIDLVIDGRVVNGERYRLRERVPIVPAAALTAAS